VKFSEIEEDIIWTLLVEFLVVSPRSSLKKCVQYLSWCGVSVTRSWVSRLLKRNGWSLKVVNFRHKYKFKPENIQYYFTFVFALRDIPPQRVKYLDETHFRENDVRKRVGWGPVGERVLAYTEAEIKDHSITITAVTNLNDPSGVFISDPVVGGNTSGRFLNLIALLVEQGQLVNGDYLIADSSPVHWSAQIAHDLVDLLEQAGVRLVFLPKYSPELNPCEYVFAQVKNYLRQRDESDGFLLDIVRAFAHVNLDNVSHFYRVCQSVQGN